MDSPLPERGLAEQALRRDVHDPALLVAPSQTLERRELPQPSNWDSNVERVKPRFAARANKFHVSDLCVRYTIKLFQCILWYTLRASGGCSETPP